MLLITVILNQLFRLQKYTGGGLGLSLFQKLHSMVGQYRYDFLEIFFVISCGLGVLILTFRRSLELYGLPYLGVPIGEFPLVYEEF